MMEGIFVLLLVIIILVGLNYIYSKLSKKYWGKIAAVTGLTPIDHPSGWIGVSGKYQGRSIQISNVNLGNDFIPNICTRVTMEISNKINGHFILEGLEFIKVKDELFGCDLSIKESSPEDFASKVFTPLKLRQRLIEVPKCQLHLWSLVVRGDELFSQGGRRDINDVVSYINILCDVAEAVEKVNM